MPYYITKYHPDCSKWAVVKRDYSLVACHNTKREATAQMIAISSSEDIEPGGTHPRDERRRESMKIKEVMQDLYSQIDGDEKALADAMLGVVREYGKFGSEGSTVYPNYVGPAENADKSIGVKCGNCVFHFEAEDGIGCSAIDADIEENGVCRLSIIPPGLVDSSAPMQEAAAGALKVGDFVRWNSSGGTARGRIDRIERNGQINVPNSDFTINGEQNDPAALITVWREGADGWAATDTKVGHKFSTLTKIKSLREAKRVAEAEKYKVPEGVQSAAKRALKWISEGKAGSGFTDVGRRRASQLASGGTVSRDTVARMKSYFARHTSDRKAEGFNAGEKGYPSPGRVAWDAWGGDAGKTWVNGINLDK